MICLKRSLLTGRQVSSFHGQFMCLKWRSSESSQSPSDASLDHTPENYKSRNVQFSEDRTRDFMGEAFDQQNRNEPEDGSHEDVTQRPEDELQSYDCHGNVSLNAVMQSTVPEPFSSRGKKAPVHYNMPGGHILQGQKYLYDDLQNTHQHNVGRKKFSSWSASMCFEGQQGLITKCAWQNVYSMTYSKTADYHDKGTDSSKQSLRSKLKLAAKDYGGTVIVFHTAISLVSLGGFYLAVSCGLPIEYLLSKLPVDAVPSGVSVNIGTFAVAYAIHKVFAPVRLGITLMTAPILVRYLRSVGVLRPLKK